MKTILVVFCAYISVFSQSEKNRDLQYQRFPDKRGLNVFETSKETDIKFEGLKVIVGGSSTLQFQGISQENSDPNTTLLELEHNFNLATANLTLDVQLENGLRMNLTTYLSSRHHHEAYVKDGYFQIDRLDFIEKGLLDKLMDKMTIKVGHMEVNYGDAHFRRSDNSTAIYNPFVGNLVLDAFNTEVAGEFYYQDNGVTAMFGLSNSKLNQDVKSKGLTNIGILGKLAYDKQINDDLRLRFSGSIYKNDKMKSVYLYSGDRTGSRYYSVMDTVNQSDDFRSGRWNPAFNRELTAMMFNAFLKYQGLEFFGTYETAKGGDTKTNDKTRTWNQIATELVYRFGETESYYLGARYNTASGKMSSTDTKDVTINRLQFALGWYWTNNVLAKFEYVNQDYNDFATTGKYSKYHKGNFNGYMMEATISF
jgi:hypothetical protein